METPGTTDGRYPHKFSSNILSVVIISASTLLVVGIFFSRLLEAGLLYTAFCALFFALSFSMRLRSFNRAQEKLVKNGVYNYPIHSKRREQLKSIILLLAVIVFVYAPFILAPHIDPILWLTSLTGLMCGINVSELLLTLHVRLWERKHGVTLVTYHAYRSDETGRSGLYEWGIRAIKSERISPRKRRY